MGCGDTLARLARCWTAWCALRQLRRAHTRRPVNTRCLTNSELSDSPPIRLPRSLRQVLRERETNKSRGFGFVTMQEDSAAERLLNQEHTLDGRAVTVRRASSRGIEGRSCAGSAMPMQAHMGAMGGLGAMGGCGGCSDYSGCMGGIGGGNCGGGAPPPDGITERKVFLGGLDPDAWEVSNGPSKHAF